MELRGFVPARSGCSILVVFLCNVLVGYGATLVNYTEEEVWDYIRGIPRVNLTQKCSNSLNLVEAYLTDQTTLEEQRRFFTASFGRGEASQFVSRDQDRWIFRAMKCIKAAGETSYSASEYPLAYCYGLPSLWESEKEDTAYGICLPSTCSHSHENLIHEWQRVVSNGTDRKDFEYEGCTKSRHSKQWYEQFVPMADFSFDMVLIFIVGIATVYHIKRGEEGSKSIPIQLLLAFSAKKNLRKLVEMPKDPQSTIQCMFGLRFLSMVWTLVGHSFIFVQAYLDNVDEYKNDLVDNFWNQWITNFTLSVDVFLTLSGTLTAYSWFKKWQKNTTEQEPSWTSYGYWLRFYRHRIVRLWPAYIYTLITVTTRLSVTHYHPMWPPTDPAVQCPKHWWENILFVNSLLDNRCMPWTWYIGTEFIFYVFSPIFLLSLRRHPSFGLGLSAVVILISAFFNVGGMLYYNFPPTQFLWRQPEIFNPDYIKHHLLLYIKPQYRIGPYIVGLLLGYYLAGFQAQTQKKARSMRFILTGWTLAFLAGFWSLYGLYPSQQGWNWPIYHLFYGATHRVVFSLALGWLMYACHTGIGGPINKLLTMPVLLPLSQLSYSVYLFHMIPVVFTYLLAPFPIVFETKWFMIGHCFVQLALSYFFGFETTMIAELPALNIERILLNWDCKPSKTLKPLPSSNADCELKQKLNENSEPNNNNNNNNSLIAKV